MYQMIVNINTYNKWIWKDDKIIDGVYEQMFSAQDFTNARNYVINMLNNIKHTHTINVNGNTDIIKNDVNNALNDVVNNMLSWQKPSSYGYCSHVCSISVAILDII